MQEKSKKRSGLIIFCLLIFILAIASGAYLLFSVWKNDRINDFKKQVNNFESLLTNFAGSSMDITEYEQLIAEANNALNEKNVGSFNELEKDLKDDTKYLQKLISDNEEMISVRDKYTEMIKKYKITEAYQVTYEETITSLDMAIAAYNNSEKNNLIQALEALEKGLLADNQKEIQKIKNSINTIGTENATASELQMISGYGEEAEELQAEGDYLAALDKLDICLELVTAIDARAAESETQIKMEDTDTYVLEGSDTRKVVAGDVSALSVYGLELAICEIYARHGATFSDEQTQAYFDAKTWYKGTTPKDEIDTEEFNKFEIANLTFLEECKEQVEAETAEESEETTIPDEL